MENSTEIIFIRHGETDFNKAGLYFGHLDPGLNETGRRQLEQTKRMLEEKEKNIEAVFSSDLKRCYESMEILQIDENVEKILLKDFREINFGIFEGKTYEEIKEEFPEEVKKMHDDWQNFKVEGGESLFEVMERAAVKLEEIIEEYKNGKVVVVAHAGVIKILVSYYLLGNLDGYWKFKIDNGSMTKMNITEEGYRYFEYINLSY